MTCNLFGGTSAVLRCRCCTCPDVTCNVFGGMSAVLCCILNCRQRKLQSGRLETCCGQKFQVIHGGLASLLRIPPTQRILNFCQVGSLLYNFKLM